MQLRKMMLVLTALGAMSGLMAGCGDDDTGGQGCTSNDDCAGTEICHPSAGVCVTTCESGSDCPDTAKTCAPLGGTSTQANTRICQCSTDVLCNGGTDSESTDLVCSDLDTVCVPKCDSNDDCGTGRVCDTASGQCEEDDTTGGTCTGEGQSSCLYGQYCRSGTCTEVPAPTCQNFDPAQGGKQPVWTSSSSGPIIFDIAKVSWANDTATPNFCPGSQTLKVRVKAYQPATGSLTFPAQSTGLSNLLYVRVNGREENGVNLIRPSEYSRSQDGKSASFTMNFCPGDINSISLGLYFTNGNEICAQIPR
ncbi:hypothetical protein [Myxococcus llanfairpwllgwyngyllgogerychwyrndrobwllllantysiliogogogochensis]|uniref:hypothetical protein n=1 Tax=Myxococcus llanfairpwllgwyngyllgogerychwyrndrobwllllantysiliogogogochensis TaxID=2590453 RepID=UPI001FE5CDFB|nr:hypothetical protein [Myxococcus llanfairpwllgwyngyllgogerychwyrndrobwllllantysiliogogogochensis]